MSAGATCPYCPPADLSLEKSLDPAHLSSCEHYFSFGMWEGIGPGQALTLENTGPTGQGPPRTKPEGPVGIWIPMTVQHRERGTLGPPADTFCHAPMFLPTAVWASLDPSQLGKP